MARQRNVQILAPESIATAGVKVIDLNTRDPISRLCISVKTTNANNTPIAHISEVIKKISIVDGSNVIYEMTGAESAALGFFKTKMQPGDINVGLTGEMGKFTADCYFGRYLWDRELALDPAHFNNLQLRVTHDKALGICTPTAGELWVNADVFDEDPPTPIGYMQAKEQYRYTQVASSWYYVDLPCDWDISMIMIGCQNSTEGPNFNAGEFKVSQDADKHVLMEWIMHNYLSYISGFYPIWTDRLTGVLATSAKSFFTPPTFERRLGSTQISDANSTIFNTASAGMVLSILGEAACNFEGVVAGNNPYGMTPIPFGHQYDMDDYWKAIPGGSKRIDIKTSASCDVSETYKVIVEQKHTY